MAVESSLEGLVPPALDGAKQLEHGRDGWLYRDVYWGGDYFAGQEVVCAYLGGHAGPPLPRRTRRSAPT